MSLPSRCYTCGLVFPTGDAVCPMCQERYSYKIPLYAGQTPLMLRFGPFIVRHPTSLLYYVCYLARGLNNDFYYQSLDWRTGELVSTLSLSSYPANAPVVDGYGRLIVPIGGSYEVAIIESPTANTIKTIDMKALGKPLACLRNSREQIVAVYGKDHGAGLLVLDSDGKRVGLEFSPDVYTQDQELIKVTDDKLVFKTPAKPRNPVWKVFDANTRKVTLLPTETIGSRLIQCNSFEDSIAFAAQNKLYLVDSRCQTRAIDLPAGVAKPTALCLHHNSGLYIGTHTVQEDGSEEAALHYRSGDVYTWVPVPTRPHSIALIENGRALVLAHSKKRGSYLISVDLDETRPDTLAAVPQSCSTDALVLHWPAAAFGAGDTLCKRPIYTDSDIPARAAALPHPVYPVPAPVIPQQMAAPMPASPVRPVPPPPEIVITLSPSHTPVDVVDVCYVTLYLEVKVESFRFRVHSVTSAVLGNQTWQNYRCGNQDFSRELSTSHKGIVQLKFFETGRIPVKLQIITVDELGRWQITTASYVFQVYDSLRRPPGTYYIAGEGMVVINRTTS